MSFEIYTPRAFGPRSLKPDQMSISPCGLARYAGAALRKVGINREVLVFIDRTKKRIALAAPSNEQNVPITVRWVKGQTAGIISLRGPLKQLGISAEKVRGRHAIEYKKADKRLIIDLSKPTPVRLQKRGKGKA